MSVSQDAQPVEPLPIEPVWELRVHGVSDTPPESVLQTLGEDPDPPPIELAAGDETVGFYRYRHPPAGRDPDFDVEAFSWGQLTSGRRLVPGGPGKDLRRAGWSLLLPFALLNVALWARPAVSATPGDTGPARRLATLVRVMALTLTVTILVTAAGFGMDLLAWQCRGGCDRNIYGFGFLSSSRLVGNGLLPLLGAIFPLAVLAGIVFVVNKTFRYEAVLPVDGVCDYETAQHPMEDLRFWGGRSLVRSLRTVHIAVGLATVGHLLAASAWDWHPAGYASSWRPVPDGVRVSGVAVSVIAGLAVVFAITAVIGAGSQKAGQVGVRNIDRTKVDGRRAFALGLVALVAGAVVAWFGNGPGNDDGSPNALPGFESTVRVLFLVQFGLLVACLLANVAAVRRADRDDVASRVPPRDRTAPDAPAWNGLATSLFTGGGLVVSLVFSAAVLLGSAWWLNTGSDAEARNATTSPTMQWAALGFVFGAAVIVAAGVRSFLCWRRLRALGYRQILDEDPSVKGNPHREEAARQASTWRGLHRYDGYQAFTRIGRVAVASFVALSLGAIVAAINFVRGFVELGSWSNWLISPHGPNGDPGTGTGRTQLPSGTELDLGERARTVVSFLANLGGWLAVLTLVGFVVLIGALYRQRDVRRTFGVVWDIVTFWPRGAHPFGPPCYAEQAVPELATRIQGLPDRRLVLAGHSQGGLLAAACLFMLNDQRRRSIYLLTYGTQITRFYGRAFPAFFGRAERERLAQRMTNDGALRWRSLWRATDPLGWPIAHAANGTDEASVTDRLDVGSDGPVDIVVRDPADYEPSGGEVVDPKVRNHSDYPKSPEYLVARTEAAAVLRIPPTPLTGYDG